MLMLLNRLDDYFRIGADFPEILKNIRQEWKMSESVPSMAVTILSVRFFRDFFSNITTPD
jgi:hypothetical protein